VVSPASKREAVAHLEHKLQVSQRRACKVISQPRSTQRHASARPARDAKLTAELRRYAMEHPRRGYRMAAAHLRRQGMKINLKRVARLWRQEGLRVPQHQHKRRRLGESANSTQRRSATRINEVWSYDFVFDETADGKRLKWLPICDEFTRENVVLRRSSSAATTGRSSSRRPCVTGSRSRALRRSTSNQAAHGRMLTARASTLDCVTSCSTARSSRRWRKQKCWAKNIAALTMISGCIRRWATSPRQSSRGVAFRPTPLRSVGRKATQFPQVNPRPKPRRQPPPATARLS